MKSFQPASNLLHAAILVCSLVISVSACTNRNEPEAEAEKTRMSENHAFANTIEKAHKMDAFQKKGVLKTNIELTLGNALDATLYVETAGPGILLKLSEDTMALFDGTEMYAMPSDSAISPFTLKTWAYFLKAPYKLNDPGTIMEEQDTAQMKGQTYNRARLTFKSGTGDTPDDWYMLYRSQDNNRLQAMAYIVTAGKTVEEANKNPHAISYENFKMIEGVPVATTWKFWGWSEADGFSSEPIGQATLSNIEFLNAGTLFEAPDGARPMKR